jgi:ribosomal protein S18 acetylase RimI-like enzyme
VAQNSWYGCYVTYTPPDDTTTTNTAAQQQPPATEIVAMGRIIGDGGWYFHIADMAVLPSHQRRGLGAAVLANLMARIKEEAPAGENSKGAYVTLFADAPGRRLYAKSGFVEAAPGQMGMMMPMGWEGR